MLSLVAFYYPGAFIDYKSWIIPLLALIMFCMGLSLTFDDFARALAMPGIIGLGLLLQYSIMPLGALLVARLLQLDTGLTAGLVLVGACPGGTASNVITYLARGNVALSISLTAISTLLSVLLTPLLTWLLVGNSIEVPAGKMLTSILGIVFLPVMCGLLINHFFGRKLVTVKNYLPLFAVAAIVFIIAIITALNQARFSEISLLLLLAVVAHNAIGFSAGYFAARVAGYRAAERRTLAIEVGMQNSGLAVALAFKYFSATAALPGAIFSIWHNIAGAALAWRWSNNDAQKNNTLNNNNLRSL